MAERPAARRAQTRGRAHRAAGGIGRPGMRRDRDRSEHGARRPPPAEDRGDRDGGDRSEERRPRGAVPQLGRGGPGQRLPSGAARFRARGPQAVHRGVAGGRCVARTAGGCDCGGRGRARCGPRRRRSRGVAARDPAGREAVHRGRCDAEARLMRVLLVDIGNTRIKWARFDGKRLGARRAAVHSAWRSPDYARRLFGPARLPEGMLVASVAGSRVDRMLAAAARRAGVPARFVTVPRRAAGVTVGYLEPWRLGVDRFVAAVGAHHLFKGVATCVVGVGTAMTIDLITAAGRHRGGVIIPAPGLMVDTLLNNTHGIRRRARGGASGATGLFGRATRAAIVQGSRYAAAATIDRAVEEASTLLGRRPLVVLTGGA